MARITPHCLDHLPRRQTKPFICLPDTAQHSTKSHITHRDDSVYGYQQLFDGELCAWGPEDAGDIQEAGMATVTSEYMSVT